MRDSIAANFFSSTGQTNSMPTIGTMTGSVISNTRTSIIDQGQVYNKRKIQREAMRVATHVTIPDQIWYDSLRGSDDGRFS
jgi:hypothetical protein